MNLAAASCEDCHVHSGVVEKLNAVDKSVSEAKTRTDKMLTAAVVILVATFGWVAVELRSLDNNVDQLGRAVAAHVGEAERDK